MVVPALALTGLLLGSGCSGTSTPSAESTTTAVTSPPAATASEPASSAAPSTEQPSQSSATPSATGSDQTSSAAGGDDSGRPSGPSNLDLKFGQTAHLQYFDVTVQRQEFGKDGVSIGWKVELCYRAKAPQADASGKVSITRAPWSASVADGETGTDPKDVPLSKFKADSGWSPAYQETHLALGACDTGWIAVHHGNPDLTWHGVVYAPTDPKEHVRWHK